MSWNICVLTPNRSVRNSKVKEIVLSTNSGRDSCLKREIYLNFSNSILKLTVIFMPGWVVLIFRRFFDETWNWDILYLLNSNLKFLVSEMYTWSVSKLFFPYYHINILFHSLFHQLVSHLFRSLKLLIFLVKLRKVLTIMFKGVQLLQGIYLEGEYLQ